jgi:CubicO group peptidase (beta-lactamase class C family)
MWGQLLSRGVIEEVQLRRLLFLLTMLALATSACGDTTELSSTSAAAVVTAPDDVAAAAGPLSSAELERTLPEIMSEAGVPGLSVAVLEEGKVAWVGSFGMRSTESKEMVNDDTVFAAASLSKPVFAYLVMLLTEDGALDLDRPLEQYLGRPLAEDQNYADLAGDDRTGAITARHVLSHSVGFPNWRFLTNDGKLRLLFDPGARFNYSGEGIALLQQVVEEVTGRGLEDLAQERLFGPFEMTRTSYIWQEDFEDNHAVPHDEFERVVLSTRRGDADAAGSLMTTAGDYARFLANLLTAGGTRGELVEAMLVPQVMIDSQQMFGPGSWQQTTANEAISLSWGLGWGRFDAAEGRAFFHTGHDLGWQAYTVTHFDAGKGVVLLSNSDNLESVARDMVGAALGDEGSPFDWLGYPVFDPDRRLEPPTDPVAIELERQVMERYVGEYEFQGNRFEVLLRQGQLWLSQGDEGPTKLLAVTETEFFVVGDNIRFRFELAEDGTVKRLLIVIEGLEVPATRVPPSPAP